ncbi:MAG: T9SS type A sorting domain-containing protein, partial [Candidatus Cloacimonetes bacterium]|nr:T9SS type A sorting domain-containing protein [Candidatus Cloacimonadota bacterium]
PGHYLSASSGSGEHSFFVDSTGPIESVWQSLAEAGFGCELQFGVLGTFNLKSTSLQLLNSGFTGNLAPDETMYPSVTVYNHSANDIVNANLKIAITSPDTLVYFPPVVIHPIDGVIPSQDSLSIVLSSGIILPSEPMQIKLSYTVLGTLDGSNTPVTSNVISTSLGVYRDPLQEHLVEHFNRIDAYPNIVSLQGQPGYSNIVYFPSLADAGSNIGSLERYNWYKYNSLPQTVLDGFIGFNNFPEEYPEQFNLACELANTERSFVTNSTCVVDTVGLTDGNMRMVVKLFNNSTILFSGDQISLNAAKNSVFFAGLFKQTKFGLIDGFMLDRWINYAEPIDSSLTKGTSKTITSLISHNEGDDTLRIVYWLQDKTSKRIYHVKSLAMPQTQNIPQDNPIPVPAPLVDVYPNPVSANCVLKVKGYENNTRVRIYNLRGQKVWEADELMGEIVVPQTVFPTSGIYFIRSEGVISGNKVKQTKKISVIK